MKNYKTLALLATLAALGTAQAESTRKRIATTAGMVTDIVTNVAGDKATVVGIMGPNVDPHLYKPTRDDVAKLKEADMIFYSGLMLEGRMADTFVSVGRMGKPVYPVTELLDIDYLMEPEDFEGHWDPHVWNDVSAWMRATEAVAIALSEQDPANAEFYQASSASYLAQLGALDAYVKEAIASIPKERRFLITVHDAFGYFGRAYGIDVQSVQGVSTESEAGVRDINELVDFIVKNSIGAIFVENITSDKAMQAVVEGVRARGHEVVVGGELLSDAMGEPGTYEGTYIGMIDHNATLIARSLGGTAPENGFQGKLSNY